MKHKHHAGVLHKAVRASTRTIRNSGSWRVVGRGRDAATVKMPLPLSSLAIPCLLHTTFKGPFPASGTSLAVRIRRRFMCDLPRLVGCAFQLRSIPRLGPRRRQVCAQPAQLKLLLECGVGAPFLNLSIAPSDEVEGERRLFGCATHDSSLKPLCWMKWFHPEWSPHPRHGFRLMLAGLPGERSTPPKTPIPLFTIRVVAVQAQHSRARSSWRRAR